MKNKKIVFLIVFLLILLKIIPTCFSVSKYGSRGEEVKQIQSKLKSWGYYSGNVDGIAGSETLKALGINSSNKTTSTTNNSDLNLLTRLVYGEARGEPYQGMVAVAATVLNRVADSRFPNTIAGVIYQSGAYTCVSDGQINLTPNEQSKKAAQDAINGWDPTYGCIYYFNPSTATSKWIWSRPQVLTIGKHIFCK